MVFGIDTRGQIIELKIDVCMRGLLEIHVFPNSD